MENIIDRLIPKIIENDHIFSHSARWGNSYLLSKRSWIFDFQISGLEEDFFLCKRLIGKSFTVQPTSFDDLRQQLNAAEYLTTLEAYLSKALIITWNKWATFSQNYQKNIRILPVYNNNSH